MKHSVTRIFALALLVLLVPLTALSEQAQSQHVLWDIPFLISKEECIALVSEKLGIDIVEKVPTPSEMQDILVFDRGTTYTMPGPMFTKLVPPDDIVLTFLGYPVELLFQFANTTGGGLSSIRIMFLDTDSVILPQQSSIERTFENEADALSFTSSAVALYDQVASAITARFGPPTDGRFYLGNDEEDGAINLFYDYPMEDGHRDIHSILRTALSYTDGTVCEVTDNVQVDLGWHRTEKNGVFETRYDLTIYVTDYIALPYMRDPFEGKDGPLAEGSVGLISTENLPELELPPKQNLPEAIELTL